MVFCFLIFTIQTVGTYYARQLSQFRYAKDSFQSHYTGNGMKSSMYDYEETNQCNHDDIDDKLTHSSRIHLQEYCAATNLLSQKGPGLFRDNILSVNSWSMNALVEAITEQQDPNDHNAR